MKTKILLIAVFFTTLTFFSCSSNDATADNTAVVSSDDVALTAKIDTSLEDIDAITEDQFNAQQSISGKIDSYRKSILPSCATITTVLTNNVWTRTIDFGTEGCTLANGNTIKGKIIISFTNDFSTSTHSISYTFEGFYHNGKLIEGNKSTTYTKKTTDLLNEIHPVMTHSIDMTVTFDDGKIYKTTGTRTREMVEGFSTPLEWEDNVFLVTGNSNITKKDGTVITCTITNPLRFEMSCRSPFPISGTKTITKNDSTATLDFGDGDCDSLATITIDNVTTEISLRK
ncbi:hypothetical protein SAMN05192550_1194 [Flavobacterium glycines]|uniref:Lipoprotein n=1 Tax=Flavobacterium glycines TaxID=551990 RepID=A0A1B9DRK1_9FLAO|nr:hypothetical protein [Flavobacterium glycines]OCB72321.1 hypothetical protein FBGL_06605 [Flavobacterium glycines]GEL09793.1 hypothetical protein FGL01_05320 [Flavobacterium glycines]SDI93384.1 hypothetical protein SAMN05192550_1194 [Flavobacterium glycines]